MKKGLSLFLILVFMRTSVFAHDGGFGGGQYMGSQVCPFPFGMPPGLRDAADDVRESMKERDAMKAKLRVLKEEKRKLAKELQGSSDDHGPARTLALAFHERFSSAIIEHIKSGNQCSDYDFTGNRGGIVSDSECDQAVGSDHPGAGSASDSEITGAEMCQQGDKRYCGGSSTSSTPAGQTVTTVTTIPGATPTTRETAPPASTSTDPGENPHVVMKKPEEVIAAEARAAKAEEEANCSQGTAGRTCAE